MTISFLWLAHSCGWLIVVVGSLLSLAHCCRWLIVVVGSLLSLAHCCRWLIVVIASEAKQSRSSRARCSVERRICLQPEYRQPLYLSPAPFHRRVIRVL